MQFKSVEVGEAFDFVESGFLGNIKTGPRSYAFLSYGVYLKARVGTVNVEVSGVRKAYPWELEQMRGDIGNNEE
jgi:hypothetical protein